MLFSMIMLALIRVLVAGLTITVAVPTTALGVECAKVISAISKGKGRGGRGSADISMVAEELQTTVAWVEHCMRVYGRRPRRPGLESAEGRENRLEALEDYEREEPIEPDDPGEIEIRRNRSKPPKVNKKKPTPSGFVGGF